MWFCSGWDSDGEGIMRIGGRTCSMANGPDTDHLRNAFPVCLWAESKRPFQASGPRCFKLVCSTMLPLYAFSPACRFRNHTFRNHKQVLLFCFSHSPSYLVPTSWYSMRWFLTVLVERCQKSQERPNAWLQRYAVSCFDPSEKTERLREARAISKNCQLSLFSSLKPTLSKHPWYKVLDAKLIQSMHSNALK